MWAWFSVILAVSLWGAAMFFVGYTVGYARIWDEEDK